MNYTVKMTIDFQIIQELSCYGEDNSLIVNYNFIYSSIGSLYLDGLCGLPKTAGSPVNGFENAEIETQISPFATMNRRTLRFHAAGPSGSRQTGCKFLVLTKISNNWPENERLWRIKRGHTAKQAHGFGRVCLAFLRYHKTSPRSVICNEYGSN